MRLLVLAEKYGPGEMRGQLPAREPAGVTEVDEDWKSWNPSQRRVVTSSLGCSQPTGYEQRRGPLPHGDRCHRSSQQSPHIMTTKQGRDARDTLVGPDLGELSWRPGLNP